MARPILDTLALAVAVAFATPLVVVGIDRLLAGDVLLGGVFLGLASAMILVEEYVLTPTDLPIVAVQKAVGVVVKRPGEEEER